VDFAPAGREDAAVDFAAAGLLEGLEGRALAEREQLLARLADEGFTLEELQAAVAEDRLALLPVQRLLGGKYTATEVAERTGLPEEFVLRNRRLLGLPQTGPDDRVFSDEEVAAAASIKAYRELGLSDEAIAEIARVLGEAMARVAATSTAVFAEAFLVEGDSEEAVAWRFAGLAAELTSRVEPVLLAAYTAHLRDSAQRGVLGRAELEAGHLPGEQDTAVCFADLVGFTGLGVEIEAQALGGVVGRFGELAAGVADAQVRLIKTIGDAAMLTAREPGALVAAALSLAEAVEDADLPAVRAGVAFGMAAPVAGDVYGHAVNLASRVTAIARPGSVLCTKEVRDAAPDEFDWSFTGRHRLKGIGESVPLYRARRLAPPTSVEEAGHRAKRRRRP
jgi:adenylate cyclase